MQEQFKILLPINSLLQFILYSQQQKSPTL